MFGRQLRRRYTRGCRQAHTGENSTKYEHSHVVLCEQPGETGDKNRLRYHGAGGCVLAVHYAEHLSRGPRAVTKAETGLRAFQGAESEAARAVALAFSEGPEKWRHGRWRETRPQGGRCQWVTVSRTRGGVGGDSSGNPTPQKTQLLCAFYARAMQAMPPAGARHSALHLNPAGTACVATRVTAQQMQSQTHTHLSSRPSHVSFHQLLGVNSTGEISCLQRRGRGWRRRHGRTVASTRLGLRHGRGQRGDRKKTKHGPAALRRAGGTYARKNVNPPCVFFLRWKFMPLITCLPPALSLE